MACAFPSVPSFAFTIPVPVLPSLPSLPSLGIDLPSLPGIPSVPSFAFTIPVPVVPSLPSLPELPGLFCPIP